MMKNTTRATVLVAAVTLCAGLAAPAAAQSASTTNAGVQNSVQQVASEVSPSSVDVQAGKWYMNGHFKTRLGCEANAAFKQSTAKFVVKGCFKDGKGWYYLYRLW